MFDAHLNTEPLFEELDELQRFKPYFAGDTIQLQGVLTAQNKSIAFELNSENAWGSIVSQGTLGQGLIDLLRINGNHWAFQAVIFMIFYSLCSL